MHRYRYLIVGGGMAGHAAAAAIRELDPAGALGMVGDEPVPPCARPSLTRALWGGAEQQPVCLPALRGLVHHAGRRAVALDARAHDFGESCRAVGKLDARMETQVVWDRPFREGAVYYLEHGRVKGVLLWGLEGRLEAARELIRRQRPMGEAELRDAISR